MDRAVFVYTTFPSLVEAEAVAGMIVERRLAACANILPGMISHYSWEGQMQRGKEVVMILKTRASLAEAVRVAVREHHSYETPAIAVIALDSIDEDYLGWILAQTRAEQQ